jgi:tetratricopeptide (TPR) repeat protein
MKTTLSILAPALASAAFAAAPATAQYGAPPPQQQPVQTAPAAAPEQRKLNISKRAMKPLTELQAAVNANDVANIPAKLAAAQAAAETVDDKYFIGQLQLKAATASKDPAAIAAAVEVLLASGGVEQAQVLPLQLELGEIRYKAKQYPQAAAAFERVLAADPANTDALILLAETRHA